MNVCPFCQTPPTINKSERGTPSYWIECTSKACEQREVRTHRCGTLAGAEKAWDWRVALGEELVDVNIKGKTFQLTKAERQDLAQRLSDDNGKS